MCVQCGAPNEVPPRDDRPLGFGSPPSQEAMRIQLLKQQDVREVLIESD